jgi:hypothetical protein
MHVSKESSFRRLTPLRVAATAIVSAGLLVPLAVFGGTGLAQTGSPAQVQYKITICHHTHSKKHPTHTIRISVKAWPAHKRHGDTMGACATAKPAKHNNGKAKGQSKNPPTGQSKSKGQGNGQNNGQGNGQNNGQGNGQNNGQGNGQAQGKGHGK